MSETHAGSQGHRTAAGPETFDTEISVRQTVMTMVWVTGIALVSALLMWLMMLLFGKIEAAAAKPPTPIQAANRQAPPPEPRLESSPYATFDEVRAEESQQLEDPAWIDREQGVVRLPIEEAIGILAERGLPGGAAPSTPAPMAETPGVGTAVPPDVQPPPPPAAAPRQPPVAAPPPGGHS